MSDPYLKIVLVGIGGYGAGYVQALQSLDPAKARLIAVVDPFAAHSPVAAKVAHLPHFDSLADFTATSHADVAILASPIALHARQIESALAAGMHVLCEKPLAATEMQARAIANQAEQTGLQVAVGFQWSFAPSILKAKQDVLCGRYGLPQIFKTAVHWPRDLAYYQRNQWAGRIKDAAGLSVHDSVIHNATAHYLHNMLFFLGDRLDAAALPEKIEAHLLRAQPIENFDTVIVAMEKEREDGKSALLLMAASHSTCQEYGPVFTYQFERGCIRFADGRLWGELNKETIEYGRLGGGEDYADKIDSILQSARDHRRPVCHAQTALPQVAVIDTLQNRFPILPVPQDRIVSEKTPAARFYVRGLDDWLYQALQGERLPPLPNWMQSPTSQPAKEESS